MLEVAELGSILSIWAHPDDETYLAGGVMAMARDLGQPVVCVSATAGERGTDDPVTWPPDRLGALRRTEAAAAMRTLGIVDHRWLDWPDGHVADVPAEEAVARIADLIDEVAPDTILTFARHGMTFHPDHVAMHELVTEAWRRRGEPGRLLYAAVERTYDERVGPLLERWGVYMSEERPDVVELADLALHVVLDEATLDRKHAALAAMPSQTGGVPLASEDYRALNRVECFVRAASDEP
jgi:LmbE family N-acetylglucosaminyl deacetylase